MQIEIMDRVAFSVVSSTCVKELAKVHPEWDERDKTLATGERLDADIWKKVVSLHIG